MPWIAAIAIAVVIIVSGGYVFWQYRTSQPPSLSGLPTYPSPVPVTDISEPQKTAAEEQIRAVAATVRPGYRVASEQFSATNTQFTWDLLRHRVGPDLKSAGYALDDNGLSSDNQVTYTLYRHDGSLRRWFNDDIIVVAGLVKHTVPTSTGDPVHFYGYFRLVPQ